MKRRKESSNKEIKEEMGSVRGREGGREGGRRSVAVAVAPAPADDFNHRSSMLSHEGDRQTHTLTDIQTYRQKDRQTDKAGQPAPWLLHTSMGNLSYYHLF